MQRPDRCAGLSWLAHFQGARASRRALNAASRDSATSGVAGRDAGSPGPPPAEAGCKLRDEPFSDRACPKPGRCILKCSAAESTVAAALHDVRAQRSLAVRCVPAWNHLSLRLPPLPPPLASFRAHRARWSSFSTSLWRSLSGASPATGPDTCLSPDMTAGCMDDRRACGNCAAPPDSTEEGRACRQHTACCHTTALERRDASIMRWPNSICPRSRSLGTPRQPVAWHCCGARELGFQDAQAQWTCTTDVLPLNGCRVRTVVDTADVWKVASLKLKHASNMRMMFGCTRSSPRTAVSPLRQSAQSADEGCRGTTRWWQSRRGGQSRRDQRDPRHRPRRPTCTEHRQELASESRSVGPDAAWRRSNAVRRARVGSDCALLVRRAALHSILIEKLSA